MTDVRDTGAGEPAYGGGLLTSALLPPVVHEASAAILVVDLRRGEVTYANALARALAPAAQLPLAVDAWAEAAGLEDVAGDDLPTESDDGALAPAPGRSESLLRVAHGEPVLGEAVTAALGTDVTAPREPLWVLGLPMSGAPEPVADLALVAFMPLRNARLVAGVQASASALRDRAVLATQVSFTITDPHAEDDPLIWVNPAFTATTGYDFDDAVGRNCRFLQGPHTDRRVVAEIGRALAAEQSITTTLLNYRQDGSPFWNELSISPIFDHEGVLTHFVGVQADVTARVEAQRARDEALLQAEVAAGRLGLLADFAKRLSGSLEGTDIVELLAEVLVPNLGTWCTVTVLDDDGRFASVVRHERESDPRIAAPLSRMRRRLGDELPSAAPTWQLLRGDRPYLLAEVGTPDARAAAGFEGWESDDVGAELGSAQLLMVPLRARDRILGTVTIVVDAGRRPFSMDDVALAQELAARAALMLENSMLYSLQLSASVALQRSLLPRLPTVAGLSIEAEYVTATDQAAVGGDWYDVFTIKDGSVGIAVGDAMGHNFDSAATMGKLSTMLRSYAWPGASPAQTWTMVDELITGTQQSYLATGVYARLHLTEGGAELSWSSAGHPAPILRLPDGHAAPLEGGRGPMLGVASLLTAGVVREEGRMLLPRGSTLLFFTDGLTDSMGEDLDINAAVDRLGQIVAGQPQDAGPADLVAALVARTGDGRKDDVAVVAVHID